LCSSVTRILMTLSLRSAGFFFGRIDPPTLRRVERRGEVFLDIGCLIGPQ
jgi:hypothetical protein